MSRKGTNLLAAILGCSVLAAGTAVSFAAPDTSQSQPTQSDEQITQQVMQLLNREMPDSFVGLKVETQNGVVTLSGQADTAVSKLKAEQASRRVHGVTDVKDNLHLNL